MKVTYEKGDIVYFINAYGDSIAPGIRIRRGWIVEMLDKIDGVQIFRVQYSMHDPLDPRTITSTMNERTVYPSFDMALKALMEEVEASKKELAEHA